MDYNRAIMNVSGRDDFTFFRSSLCDSGMSNWSFMKTSLWIRGFGIKWPTGTPSITVLTQKHSFVQELHASLPHKLINILLIFILLQTFLNLRIIYQVCTQFFSTLKSSLKCKIIENTRIVHVSWNWRLPNKETPSKNQRNNGK